MLSTVLTHLKHLNAKSVALAALRHPILALRALTGGDSSAIPSRTVKRYVRQGSVLIEAGGFDGQDTSRLLGLLVPERVIVVEPHPDLAQALRHRFSGERRITVIEAALGSGTEPSAQLFTFGVGQDPHGSSSLLAPELVANLHPEVGLEGLLEVPLLTLRSLLENEAATSVGLLWLDVQGAELDVLKSAEDLIQVVEVIHLEVSMTRNYSNAPLEADVHGWLESKGFRRVARRVLISNGNALYVRRRPKGLAYGR